MKILTKMERVVCNRILVLTFNIEYSDADKRPLLYEKHRFYVILNAVLICCVRELCLLYYHVVENSNLIRYSALLCVGYTDTE